MQFRSARKYVVFLLAVLLLFSACSKSQPKKAATDTLDLVTKSPTPPPQHILDKTIIVQSYERVELVVPPNCLTPRLHGRFRSYRYGQDGKRTSDAESRIDLLLLDEQEFDDFVQGSGGTATATTQEKFEQEIDWALRSTFSKPQKYYLVFNNATGKPKTKAVQADFTLSFD